jgi:hypothetical protein
MRIACVGYIVSRGGFRRDKRGGRPKIIMMDDSIIRVKVLPEHHILAPADLGLRLGSYFQFLQLWE